MKNVQVGDAVRIKFDGWCDGLIMVVEEVRSWGVIGTVPTPNGDAPMRLQFDEIVAVWRPVPDA